MQTTILDYRIIIEPEEHKGKTVYTAFCPALGVADWGQTIEASKQHIQEAIQCQIESMIKQKSPIPPADSPEFTITMASVTLPKDVRHLAFA
ncbi:type II toxin-antitoxin system HicB family antitoxin [Candidatus Gottesmanbacteria bacterium]|nr:type II toxin-antitoxin system HicB family antitoxin [Candidatus Gottesmanbacteria bacterium]